MGRAERGRPARPFRLSLRPRRAAGLAALSSAPFARRLQRGAAGLLLVLAGLCAVPTVAPAQAVDDPTLDALALTDGDDNAVSLDQTFDSDTDTYTASVGDSVTRVTIARTTANANATVAFLDGNDAELTDADTDTDDFDVDLDVGDNVIRLKVTAEDGIATQTYQVTVTRAQYVCEAPTFPRGRREIWSATMEVGVFSHENSVDYGYSRNFFGALSKTTFDFRGDRYTLDEIFYNTLAGGWSFGLAETLPEADSALMRLHICGDSFDLSDDTSLGANYLWTSDDPQLSSGITVSVALSVEESTDAALSGLKLEDPIGEAIALSPSFVFHETGYTARVANAVSEITVTPTARGGGATIRYRDGDGNALDDLDPIADGHQIGLKAGTNTIEVRVTSEDGKARQTYTVDVTRARRSDSDATLRALELSEGVLSPAFAPGVTGYTVEVVNSVAEVTVMATRTDSGATVEFFDGENNALADSDTGAAGQQLGLDVGANTINVVITAGNGIATRTYTVVMTRAVQSDTDATLGRLELERLDGLPATLTPAFDPETLDYMLEVTEATRGLGGTRVGLAASDSEATLEIDDNYIVDVAPVWQTVVDGYVTTNLGVEARETRGIQIRVTAGDGTTRKIYTVTVAEVDEPVVVEEFRCEFPDLTNRIEVWSAFLTVGSNDVSNGYFDLSFGALTDTTFEYRDQEYGVWRIVEGNVGLVDAEDRDLAVFSLNTALPNNALDRLRLHLCDVTVNLAETSRTSSSQGTSYSWQVTSLDWSDATQVLVALSEENVAPVFEDAGNAALYRRFAADGTRGLTDIGAPFTATDENGDTLVYSLAGDDAEFFDINPDTGQLRTSSNVFSLLYTDESSYAFEVVARDGNGGTARVAVTVYVVYPFDKPRVSRAGSTSLSVTWTAPSGAGTAVTEYGLRYRQKGTSAWTAPTSSYTATSAPLSGLREDTGYEVQIRPYYDFDGVFGPWSESGVGNTGNAASGRPDILGVTEAGERLTANRDAVTDPDGTTKADGGESGYAYAYQWIRVGTDAAETDIAGATGRTYLLTGSDAGKRIKVRVSFTDDADNPERVTSEAVGPVASARGSCDARHVRDGEIDWCTDMTVGTATEETDLGETIAVYGYRGSSPRYGLLVNDNIVYNTKRYTVERLTLEVGASTRTVTLELSGGRLPGNSGVILGETEFLTGNASVIETTYRWNVPSDFVWVAGQTVVVSVGLDNFGASGRPGIRGLARVGETLTATTSDIVDHDGKSRAEAGEPGFAYTYQWRRIDGRIRTDIAGATASTYTLVDADEGKKVDVRVGFTDDTGIIPDDDYEFGEGPLFSHAFPMRFAGIGARDPGGAPVITGTTVVGDELTANLGTIADADGLPAAFPDDYTFQWVRVDGAVETDIPGATSDTYMLMDPDRGMRIKVKVSFTDGGGNAEGPRESAATDVVAARTATSCLANSDWCTTMTVGVHPRDTNLNPLGYLRAEGSAHGGFDSGDTIPIGRRFQRIIRLLYDSDSVDLYVRSDHEIPFDSVLKVGEIEFTATSSYLIEDLDRKDYVWDPNDFDYEGFDWSPGHRVMVSLKFGNFVPVLESATVNGTTLVLTWYEDLDPNSVPAATAFEVDADGTEKAVSSVSVTGNTVTLTLETAVTSSQTVTLDYTVPSINPLQDLEGLDAAALTNEAVTNYTDVTVPVAVDFQYKRIGGGLEALVFMLEREGLTTESLEVTVTLTQDEDWLADTDLEHTVTFAVGESTKTLIIPSDDFSLEPDSSGDLTATVTGTGVSGGSDTVEVVSTPGPALTIRYEREYTVEENDADAAVYVFATLDPAYPRAPTVSDRYISFSSRADTATSPKDYAAISLSTGFRGSEFALDTETGRLVARKAIAVAPVNDMVYEGTERFTILIEQQPSLRAGYAQIERPDGSTCTLEPSANLCSPEPRFSVFITDEGDRELPVLSLTADPMSIAEEDDSSTTEIFENVSTLTVAITNGKTYATAQTITLTFEAKNIAEYGTDYTVTPADANTVDDAGHQVVLAAGASSVALTITAAGNDTDDGNEGLLVTAALGETEFARTFITILDEESTDSNTAATGKPIIEGTVEGDPIVGHSLTVNLDNIEDANELESVSYFYQWVRVDTLTVETPLSVSPIYTPVLADVDSTIKVQVSFIDDALNPEGPLESDAVGPVLATFNAHPAEGQPSIEGVAQVGKELTAGAGDMADGDNLPDTTFPDGYTFQWVSVDSVDDETDIAGAMSQTYAPAAADVGNRLRVKVSFTDGGDTVETLASDLVGPVAPSPEGCAARTDADWCATLTAGVIEDSDGRRSGYFGGLGRLDDTVINYGPSFEVQRIEIDESLINDETVTVTLDAFVPLGTVFNLGGTEFTDDGRGFDAALSVLYIWDRPADFTWLEGQEVTVSANLAPLLERAALDGTTLVLTYAENLDTGSVPAAGQYTVKVDGDDGPAVSDVVVSGNTVTLTLAMALTGSDDNVTLVYMVPTSNPLRDVSGLNAPASPDGGYEVNISAARGQPAIAGVPQVDMELMAGQGDIADTDGLPGAFPDDYTFQWVRVDDMNTETDIGSDSHFYTPVAADVGNSIRVEVSFTDGANNPEGPLASDPVGPVVAAAGICAADSDWRATLMMGYQFSEMPGQRTDGYGFDSDEAFGGLVPDMIRLGSADYAVTQLMRQSDIGLAGDIETTVSDFVWITVSGSELPDGTRLNLGETALTVGTDSATTTAGQERWNLVSLGLSPTWVGGQEQTVCANLAPLLARAVVDGTTLTLTYAENLDTGSVPAVSAFEVDVNGADGPAVTDVVVSGNTVTLTLATAITVLPDTVVTLDYEVPSSNPLQDLSGLDAPLLSNRSVETDPRGAKLTPPALEVNEDATLPYTVELTEAPTGLVTVTLGVSGAGVTVSTPSLSFTPTTWDVPQTVEVTAVEDENAVDEEVTVTHTPSGGGYDGATLPDLAVTVVDNDGGIEADREAETINEGAIGSYTLRLTRRPTSDVTVTVTGGAGKVIATPSTLTFTTDDWDLEKSVFVDAVDDTDKNDESVTLRHTATGGGYSVEADGARAAPVKVTVQDDEATAPGAPDLNARGANESVRLAWSPPGDNGGAPVTDYRYRRVGGTPVAVPGGAEARSVSVPDLVNGTEYSFELQALNRVGEGEWSTAQTATPIPLTLTVEAVDDEVTEGEPVRYRIVMSECADWVSVNLVYAHEGEFMGFAPSSSGQGIRCVGGEKAWEIERGTVDDDDIEAHGSFTVTLRPGDGYGLGTPSSATIRILDNDGGTAPGAPPRPAVAVVSPRILDATWRAAPDNGAALTGYALEYREGTAGPWTPWPEAIAPEARSVRIEGLAPGTSHQVRVRANNVRGDGPWSTPGEARTAPDPGVRVSIARPDNSSKIGTEGDTLAFTVHATPAPASALRVDVRVTETLETILGRTPTSVTVPAGQDSVSFEVRTEDDDEDESHYSRVTAELRPSVRYVLEGTRAVTYTVIDNDADTERGRPLRPRVEAIEDPNTRPQVREVAEDPVVTLRLTWGAPADIPLAQVRGWLVEWAHVASCSEPVPTDESWPGGGNIEVETREFLHRPRNAAHLRVAAILVGDGIGQWSETVCGDVGDFVPEPDEEPGPSVTSVSVAPDPNRNGRWTPGEALTVSVEFSDTVAVLTADGTPSIRVYTDAGARDAVYSRGSGTRSLTFVYTISDTDETVLSVVVAPNSLALNGGAIVGRRGRAAVLEHEKAERSGTPPSSTRSVQRPDTDTSEGKDSDPPEKAEPPSVSVADAEVREGPGAALQFAVRLSRAASDPVTVGYRSTDKSATAGQDYRAVSGTLRFAPGETTKRVRVEVLDDAHDEGREVMLLVLISAEGAGATLGDSVAEGTIENTDPMPRAWLGRFGRTASDHVIGAIESRFAEDAAAQPQSHLTVGGRRLDEEWRNLRTALDWERVRAGFDARTDAPAPPDPRLRELSSWERMDRLKAETMSPAGVGPAGGSPADSGLAGEDTALRSSPAGGSPGGGDIALRSSLAGEGIALRSSGEAAKGKLRGMLTELLGLSDIERLSELSDIEADLLNTSFFYSGALDGNGRPRGPQWLGQWSAWGQSAATRFAGAEGDLSVNGEVTTATVGFDTRRERLMAGVALAYSEGQGAFALPGASGGAIASTLTSLHPFAQYRINERASVWGVIGHGTGELTLTPQGAPDGIEADLSTSMAAFGGRGVLSVRSAGEARFEIALRSDARFTNTVSDAVEHLGGATGATSRVRLVVEGRGSLPLLGGVLSPTLEAGLRHDDGDAERGAGLEIGGGLAYASGRLSVALNARGLLAHRDEAYREWGVSGTVRFTPRKDGRGLSVDLGSTWGVAQSGVQSLWSAGQASDLARAGAFEAGQRFQAQLAYGFDGRKGRARWQPYLKADAGENGTPAFGVGLKMTSGEHIEAGLEIGTNATESERAGGLGRGLHGPGNGAADASRAAIRLQGSLRW